ncbi:hypothetical protein [Azospirillum sp.]|uniref:hypothetical protein n=1 Tax=Azospirillum sp. TaxID=34012 RepID=UPI002D2E3777|nr:hypothetical protein [Azospirillum sp.]HYD68504.1 hypothetical protein [Azospirillum sp.]
MKTDLEAKAALAAQQIELTKVTISEALLTGNDTADARARLADLEREHASFLGAIADEKAMHDARQERLLEDRASSLAAASAERISQRMAALAIPNQPVVRS